MYNTLLQLKNSPPPVKTAGICYNITELRDDLENWPVVSAVGQILEKYWPLYSGLVGYPVPHPDEDADDAYEGFCGWGNLWDRRTAYGKNRYSALECLIEHSNELAEIYNGLIS